MCHKQRLPSVSKEIRFVAESLMQKSFLLTSLTWWLVATVSLCIPQYETQGVIQMQHLHAGARRQTQLTGLLIWTPRNQQSPETYSFSRDSLNRQMSLCSFFFFSFYFFPSLTPPNPSFPKSKYHAAHGRAGAMYRLATIKGLNEKW